MLQLVFLPVNSCFAIVRPQPGAPIHRASVVRILPDMDRPQAEAELAHALANPALFPPVLDRFPA